MQNHQNIDEDFKSFLDLQVTIAMRSLNLRANDIIEEIRFNHRLVMQRLEFKEMLGPCESIEQWWTCLSEEDRDDWLLDYHQHIFYRDYIYDIGGDYCDVYPEETAGDFTHSVYRFLETAPRPDTGMTW